MQQSTETGSSSFCVQPTFGPAAICVRNLVDRSVSICAKVEDGSDVCVVWTKQDSATMKCVIERGQQMTMNVSFQDTITVEESSRAALLRGERVPVSCRIHLGSVSPPSSPTSPPVDCCPMIYSRPLAVVNIVGSYVISRARLEPAMLDFGVVGYGTACLDKHSSILLHNESEAPLVCSFAFPDGLSLVGHTDIISGMLSSAHFIHCIMAHLNRLCVVYM